MRSSAFVLRKLFHGMLPTCVCVRACSTWVLVSRHAFASYKDENKGTDTNSTHVRRSNTCDLKKDTHRS